MKLKLILSILFIIATTFTALHEIEHVKNHDSSTCQICIVDNHSVSADVVVDFKEVELFSFESIFLQTLILNSQTKQTTYKSRAPPQIS
ncbi:MAG: hypothetical protein NTW78_00750 [Campylobacterales bacterium]|nr:hypothetical protein [Campylobacterales bacterium]